MPLPASGGDSEPTAGKSETMNVPTSTLWSGVVQVIEVIMVEVVEMSAVGGTAASTYGWISMIWSPLTDPLLMTGPVLTSASAVRAPTVFDPVWPASIGLHAS